jgi:uncharacterized protein with PIN domain
MRTSQRQNQVWEQFEGRVKQKLEESRRRFLLANSFDEMEDIVDEVGGEIEQDLLRVAAEQREPEGGMKCSACGAAMKRKDKKARQMTTSKGDVRFERERWVCPACGASVFPPR